jgi:hypothetical protein
MPPALHHNIHDDIIVDILQGRERISSYPATSQLDGRGVSSSALTATNFARVLFQFINKHGQDGLIDVLRAITSEKTIAVSVSGQQAIML